MSWVFVKARRADSLCYLSQECRFYRDQEHSFITHCYGDRTEMTLRSVVGTSNHEYRKVNGTRCDPDAVLTSEAVALPKGSVMH